MPNLTLEPGTTALVLIDLQKMIIGRPGAGPRTGAEVVRQAAALTAKFREAGAAVVLVHVDFHPDRHDILTAKVDSPAFPPGTQFPPDWADFAPELNRAPGDIVIVKRQWGAFYGTELDLQLRRRGIRTIVLAGIATNLGVESTARDAYERGYEQVFVEDAMTSVSAEAHEFAVKTIFPRIGRVASTAAVLEALAR